MTDPYSAIQKDYKTIIKTFIANEERKLDDNPKAEDVELFKEGNDETAKTTKRRKNNSVESEESV